jgi:hypothetical protein
MNEHLIPAAKERLFFKDFEFTNEHLIKPEIRQIFDLYKEVKRPLQSYSSTKSLKKTTSKSSLKRQNSSPYLQLDSSGGRLSKFSVSKSPKRKNKSIDIMKLKNHNMGTVATRSKLGGTF